MRKLFTRFLSVFMVLLFSLGAYAQNNWTTIPADDSPAVKKTDEISVTFLSDVSKGAGYVRFYEDAATDVPLFVELVSDSRIVVSGKKVVFQFNSLMADSKSYYITWDLGAFKTGTPAANVPAFAVGDWNWSTVDITAPVLDVQANGSHFNYKSGSTNVVTAAPTLTMLFKENVQPTTGAEQIYIMKDNGTALGDVVQVLTKANFATHLVGPTAGKQIDITLTSALAENTTYYVMVDAGAITDSFGNKFAGFLDKATWTFSTKDTSAPVMTIKESEVTKTKVSYSVEFNEKGKLYYMVVANGSTPAPTSAEVKAGVYASATTLASGTLSYTAAGSKVVEVPTSATVTNTIQGGAEYDIYFASETYINVQSVTETLLADPVTKDIKFVDNYAPVATLAPTGSGVLKNQKLSLTFLEDIQKGTGSITVKKSVDNTVFETFDIANAKISANKKSIEIDLTNDFASTTSYYVLVPDGVITDLAGNSMAAISSITGWTFTSQDYAAPTFTYAPANGSTSTTATALNGSGIQITFSEPIRHRDVSGSPAVNHAIVDNVNVDSYGLNQALILKENGVEKAIDYSLDVATQKILTIIPDGWSFAADKEYSLTFLAWYVADTFGNIIPSSSSLIFRTLDNVAPTASIAPGTLDKTGNIVINFTEPVRLADNTELTDTNVDAVIVNFLKAGTTPVDFDATVSADKKQIIINPTGDLESSTAYTINIGGSSLEDYNGVAFAAASLSKTVKDYIKPTVTLTQADGITPLNGAIIASGTLSGKVVFSESVVKVLDGATPDISLITLRLGSVTGVDVPVTFVSYAANTLSFTANIDAGKTYYLAVGASVKDTPGGNVNEAVTSVFTTLSNVAPTIATTGFPATQVVTPLNNATGVLGDAVVTVTFKDAIAAIVNESMISFYDGTTTTYATGSSLSADGKTLTINHAALPTDKTIVVTLLTSGTPVTSSAVQSQNNTLQTVSLSWSFKTKDTTPPVVSSLTPINTATGVLITSTGPSATVLKLTFPNTDNLHLGTGDVKIRKSSNDAIVQQLGADRIAFKDAAAAPGDGTKEIVEVSLNADLDYATTYYVQVSPTLILDAENNAYAGIATNSGWVFTTQAAPAFAVDIAKSNPKAYQDSVLETADLVVKFNNNLGAFKDNSKRITLDEVNFTAGSPNPTVTLKNNVFSLPPNDPAFTWAGNTLTINYIVDLLPNKAYRLTFEGGAVKDVYDGLLTGTSYVFFTGGKQGPVATFTPADAAKNIAKNANVVITFNEPFYSNTLKAVYTPTAIQNDHSIIRVDGTGSGHTDMSYVATIEGNVITLDLPDFLSSEVITVTVGAGKFYDEKGNIYDATMDGLGDAQTASFTVVDFAAPTASINATSSITGTGFKYKVSSTEKGIVYSKVVLTSASAPTKAEIAAATSTGISTAGGVSSDIVVTGLTPSTSYTIYFYGKDEAGNEQAVQSLAVTTIDDVAPVLASFTPANGAVGVAKDANIDLVFDEALTLVTSPLCQILVKEKATGTIVDSYPAGTAFASVNGGKTARFNSAVDFNSATTYVVEVDKGTIKDVAGNAYNSFVTFEFTTVDYIKPTVALTNPNNTATIPVYTVQNGNGLVLTFSEAVKNGTESVKVYEDVNTDGVIGGTDILVQLIDPSTMVASADGKTRTFNITNPLKQQSSYLIEVATTSFKDLADNALSAAYVGKITVVDTTAPVPSHTFSTVPATADVDVAVSANIIVNFDEKIFWNVHPVAGYLYDNNIDSLITVTGPNGAVAFDATIDAATNKIVTINPTNNLKSLTTYTVTVSQVQDAQKNLMSTYSFSFKTGSYMPPLAIFDPKHGVKTASEVGPFMVTFDKNVYVYTASVGTLPVLAPLTTENVKGYLGISLGTDIATGLLASADFTATVTDGKVVTITPKAALTSTGAAKYTYGILDNATIYDNLGNAVVGVGAVDGAVYTDAADSTYATVTIKDLTAPTVVAKSLAGGTDVDEKMWMKFNEKIAIGTGNLSIRKVEDGKLIETIAANATNLSVNSDTLFIKHANFPLNTNFYVVIDNGFATDLSGNKYKGIADDQVIYNVTTAPFAWNFNTVDTNKPMLKAQSPKAGAVDVLVGQNLKLTFNKAVYAGTGFISIYKADGTPHQMISVPSASVAFNQYAADTVVTISHIALAPETQYFVRVSKGTIVDAAGNAFDGIANQDWSFTTEDVTAPKLVPVTGLTPADNSTDIASNQLFTMTFDRNVAKGTGNIKLFDRTGANLIETLPITNANVTIDKKVVSFKFTKPFAYSSEYYIIVESGAITNASVNAIPFAGITTALAWSFTTGGDVDAPKFVSGTPTGTMAEGNHPTFIANFDENVVLGTGNLKVIKKDGTTPVLTIPVTSAVVSGKTITVTYVYDATKGGLDKNTEYYVLMDAGVVKDAAGNASAATTDVAGWTFKTGANFTTPVIDPKDNSLVVKVFPNPFVNEVTIESTSEISKVVVSNIAGQVVKEVVNPSNPVQLDQLVSGVYFMSLYEGNTVIKTVKIVKR
jgi:hypothetical protein